MINLFILGIAVLIAFLLLSRWYVSANPKTLKKGLMWIGLTVLVVLVVWLALSGKLWAAVGALPVVFMWFMRMFTGLRYAQMFARMFGLGGGGKGWHTPGSSETGDGQGSTVRTAFVEVHLDHASGHMSGLVLAGSFQGRSLDSLSQDEALRLYAEAASDADSVRVIESFLDRRFPDWRNHTQHQSQHTAPPGNMDRAEALKVLGLQEGASEADIKAAHRRLMANVHPDKGGSDYLAQQINWAKDVLLD
ncbi:DnaJ domain-containing protein [Magnetovibrio sp. PR-2]|uniref:DnaJ domain-containing protein n=1 Tax=Magnetovibrio sp. PR-2 TaxID=3120356 RepID=UPI002FCE1BF5